MFWHASTVLSDDDLESTAWIRFCDTPPSFLKEQQVGGPTTGLLTQNISHYSGRQAHCGVRLLEEIRSVSQLPTGS
jgi:hypothetical protein